MQSISMAQPRAAVSPVSSCYTPHLSQTGGGWVAPPADDAAPWTLNMALRPAPAKPHQRPVLLLRDLSHLNPETEVVNPGSSAQGRVTALGQTHGGYMAPVSQLAILRELTRLQPRHIFVEGMLEDGTPQLLEQVRQRARATLRKAGQDPARQGADFLLLMGEVGAAAVYAAFVDPSVRLHCADVPQSVRVQARRQGGNVALANVTFNVRETKVFNDVAATLRQEPGANVAIVFGFGHDFQRLGPQFFGRDGFNPNFVWKNTSGFPMREVRVLRQEARDNLQGKPEKRIDFKLELDEAHPPWLDASLQSFLRKITAEQQAA